MSRDNPNDNCFRRVEQHADTNPLDLIVRFRADLFIAAAPICAAASRGPDAARANIPR